MTKLKLRLSTVLAMMLILISAITFASIKISAANWPSSSNIKTYVLSTSNNTTVYKTATSTSKYGTIYASDLITIKGWSGTRLKVTYPVSGGTKTGYINVNSVTTAAVNKATNMTAPAGMTAYRRSSGNSTIGSISKSDNLWVLATKNNRVQVIYPISGGYKIGWVNYNSLYSKPTSTSTQTTKIWPVGGNGGTDKKNWPRYTSGKYHSGTDISAPVGTPVYSTYDGVVDTVADLGNTSYGKYIIVKCNVNNKTVYIYYAHLSAFNVSKGATVKAGQQIGKVGSTGNSTGPHLHYEVRNSNKHYGNVNNPTLNPYDYLPAR